MFSWKKKTSIFIGRFQPFHEGHKKIFLKILKNSEQVAILVMDSHKVGIKNPLSFKSVKRKIDTRLKLYKKKYIIIKIPVVKEVIYGRKVGYKFKKILNKKTENLSSTKIRKNAKKRFGKRFVAYLEKADISDLKILERN